MDSVRATAGQGNGMGCQKGKVVDYSESKVLAQPSLILASVPDLSNAIEAERSAQDYYA